jgi:phosphopantetheinyl transferase
VDVTIGWADPFVIGSTAGLLDARERTRADTFVRAPDRLRFIAQHALVRCLVTELTGDDPDRLDLGSRCPVCGGADHGRPVLLTDPSVQLSASRSGQRVVAAVTRGEAPIGIDVEPVVATASAGVAFDAVALTPGERAWVLDRPEPERALARTATWVRKEAVLKRAGTGLTMSPAEFDVAASGDVLTDVDVGQDYRCALATATPARITVVDVTARLAGLASPV